MYPSEYLDHRPMPDFDTLVKEYVHGDGYLCIHARASSEFSEQHRGCVHLKALGLEGTEVIGAIRAGQSVPNYRTRDRGDGDFPVLIPVAHFVEQPEGVSIERLPSRVWGQSADFLLRSRIQEFNTPIGRGDGVLADGELGCLFVLRRHRRRVLLRQGEDEVVKAVPEALEGVPRYEGQFIRKWLQHLCLKYEAPFAIGLLKDSIAIARPEAHKCFDVINMRLCSGEFQAVTR